MRVNDEVLFRGLKRGCLEKAGDDLSTERWVADAEVAVAVAAAAAAAIVRRREEKGMEGSVGYE